MIMIEDAQAVLARLRNVERFHVMQGESGALDLVSDEARRIVDIGMRNNSMTLLALYWSGVVMGYELAAAEQARLTIGAAMAEEPQREGG